MLAFCRSELAREKLTGAALIQETRVIVEVFREQARSYRRRASPLPHLNCGAIKHRIPSHQFSTTAPTLCALRRLDTNNPAATTSKLKTPVAMISTRWASWNSMMVSVPTMNTITA